MQFTIRDVREHELEAVLAVNNSAGAGILPMDHEKLRFFWEQADYFRVIEQEGTISGFLIALSQDAPHTSSNFLWFRERFDKFLYIDRIVIARPRRGGGRGRAMYADVINFAEPRYPALCCEVFVDGGDNPALLFHASMGFKETGLHTMPGDQIHASMQTRALSSHEWIKTEYANGLPKVSWLAAREIPARKHMKKAAGV